MNQPLTIAQAVAERVANGGTFRRPQVDERTVDECARLWEAAWGGNRFAQLTVMEALSTSDFKYATWTVLDRQTMDRYADLPATWTQYAGRTTVRDFKKKRLIDLMKGKAALSLVPELTEYPADAKDTAYYDISVGKYGKRFDFSWESQVNDDIDLLQQLPDDLATSARDTESRTAAALLTDGNGENGAAFSATAWGGTQDASGTWSGRSSNLLAGNPALTYDNLLAALDAISQRLDPEGRPIYVKAYKLVIPPTLETTADKILGTTVYRSKSTNLDLETSNLVAGRVSKVVEPWLGVLDTGSNKATQWYLVPDPAVGRPALFLAFLRGYETPDLRIKADGGQRLGGGDVDPRDGSFDDDSIQMRARHVMGGASADMIASATSNGSGS